MDDEFAEIVVCPVCDGDCRLIGQLGSLLHFRCRYCGALTSALADAEAA